MTDLNVKKEYLNLIYADCGKGSAGEKIKELVTVPGTQYLIFGVILGVFPLLAQLGILTSSFVFAMGNTMIYAIMAIGFCLLMGYSGLASLGTAGFVGIGAYIAYYFMQVYGAPFGIAFIVTVMISLFSGVLVGFISLRIEGIYLAILTLGLSEILRNTFISLKSSIKLDMSKVRLFGVKIGEEQVYLLILALFVLLLFITSNLIRSPIGRALLSVKNSTSAAQAMGINLMKYRVLAFVISTVYAANSPTLDEAPLQQAILAALNTAMADKNSLIRQITDAMETEIIPFPGGMMSLGDIERRLRELEQQFQTLLEKAADDPAAYGGQFKEILDEQTLLKGRRSGILADNKEQAKANQRIMDAAQTLENASPYITEWDESAVRQLVETVKILSKDEVAVTLKGGIELCQKIMY